MNFKIAVAVLALLTLTVSARAAGDTMLDSAQTQVNGKPYVQGQVLKNGDKLVFNGPGYVKINGITLDFTGQATAVYKDGVLQINSVMPADALVTETDAKGASHVWAPGDEMHGTKFDVELESGQNVAAGTAMSNGSTHQEDAYWGVVDNYALLSAQFGTISPEQGVQLQVSPSAP